jgi:hypothetical protein
MLCVLILQNATNPVGPMLIGHLDPAWYWRAGTSLILSLLVVWWAKGRILTNANAGKIPYVIAFNITIFVMFGLALAATASREWATACLCSGACLLAGGFIGLLFGIPYGRTASDIMAGVTSSAPTNDTATAAQVEPQEPEAALAPQVPLASAQSTLTVDTEGTPRPDGPSATAKVQAAAGRNLLEDTASSLSKLLTGASLVKVASIYHFFQRTSLTVGYYLTDGNLRSEGAVNPQYASANIAVLGGALILYFLMLGFLSGLFLPAYFMKGWDS